MSKSPLLEENVVRRWAKYAGIQEESTGLISEMYHPEMEEGTKSGQKKKTSGTKRGSKKGDEANVNEDDTLEEGDSLEEDDTLEEGEFLEEDDLLS